MHALTITTELDTDVLTLAVTGEIDMSTAPALRDALHAAISAEPMPRHIRVDLDGVPFLDSSGISVLISGWKNATAAGAQFSVHNPQPIVYEVMNVSGVSSMFTDQPASS